MRCFLPIMLLVVAAATSRAQEIVVLGEKAADFPPGFFTDGGKYQVGDFKGKALVLTFFERTCPGCQAKVPERNALISSLQGKPVAFLGIVPNASPAEAVAYVQATGLNMPLFADNLGVMQARYNTKISLENIWQVRIVDAEGKLMGLEFKKEAIEKVISQSPPDSMFKAIGADAKFAPVMAPFEHGQFAAGMKLLTNVRKTAKKTEQPTLGKIYDTVKQEAGKWKREADEAANVDPVLAYDLYSRIAATFPGDDLGKAAQVSLKKVAATKAVTAELAARVAYNKVAQAMSAAVPAQKPMIASGFADIGKKYPDTPTSFKAKQLADELGYQPPLPKKK